MTHEARDSPWPREFRACAKKAIGGLAVGGVMEVQATDSGTLKDIPAWSKKMGHEYLGSYDDAGYLCLFLRKMK